MPSSLDPQPNRGLFALFKGDSGAGKTTAAASFPNVCILDHDKKMPAIPRKHYPGKDVSYFQFGDIFELSEFVGNWQDFGCPYETVIADSLTSLSYNIISSIAKVKGEETPKLLHNLKGTKNKVIEMLGYDYYNGETRFFKYYIEDVLKTMWMDPNKNPKHVIVIAHVLTVEREDPKTRIKTVTRSIVTAGKAVAAWTPAQFDEVWHFAVEAPDLGSDDRKGKRICMTSNYGDDYAKTAYNLPSRIEVGSNFYEQIKDAITL
jgi:hypothetical protein